MYEELHSINDRTHDLIKQAFSNHPQSFYLAQIIYNEELSANKIKLERLFSETDVKEQSDHTSQFAQAVVMMRRMLFMFATRVCSGQNGCSRLREIISWDMFVSHELWRSTYLFVTNSIWILVSRSWFRLRGYVSKLTRRDTFHQSSFISTTLSFFDCRQGGTNWYVMWAVQYWENFVRGKIWWLWKIC